MKKILIFLEKNKINPKGGPYGYNYNLLQGLEQKKCDYIIETIETPLEKEINSCNSHLTGVIKKAKFYEPYSEDLMDKFLDYDVIHFHTSVQMFKARNFLKKYKGIVLFTTHSPMLLSKEMKCDANPLSRLIFFPFFKKLKKVDEFAFNRANYIIFPCEEAEEPYWKEDIYKKAKSEKKFIYMPTGVIDCKPKIAVSKDDYRKKYNIPEDAFVISYVGRHNEVKGYLDLKNAAEEILKKEKKVYFLIGGKEAPLKGLKNERWIEVGYTKDPYSLINASDMFVLPNRQTYFDLVFLEVLSIDKKMIVSSTGGNRYFKKFDSKEIIFYENHNLCKTILDELSQSNKNSINRKIYLQEFTCEKFAERYIHVLDSVINKDED